MSEYYNLAADLLGLPRPAVVSLEEAKKVMGPAMYSFLSESRRIDNRKMLNDLGIQLLYPTLKAGLFAAINCE